MSSILFALCVSAMILSAAGSRSGFFDTQLDVTQHSEAFQTVIADWVDSYDVPYVSLGVNYGSQSVSTGASLSESVTKAAPTVTIEDPHPTQGDLYTLLMVDPDAVSPAKPIYRNYLHWIVTNIPTGAADALKQGTEVVAYSGPSSPMGVHRYYLLLFKQKSKLSMSPYGDRQQFSVRSFTEQFGLGYPVGGSYFTVQAGM